MEGETQGNASHFLVSSSTQPIGYPLASWNQGQASKQPTSCQRWPGGLEGTGLINVFTLAFGGGQTGQASEPSVVQRGPLTRPCPFQGVLMTAATWGPQAGATAVQGGDLLNPEQLMNLASREPWRLHHPWWLLPNSSCYF